MSKYLLIDAAHEEELRVAVVNNGILEEFDCEVKSKKNIKGNIYLAKIIRIEPALQAAFIDYGNDKQGFLPFSEIHKDYYRIPVSDRQECKSEDGDADTEQATANHRRRYRYRIQEVIQNKQIILVQAVKEQRGNKGASFTTFISLAGRYCVLMPNAGDGGGGVSKKINDDIDRKRLKTILNDLDIPQNMGLIVRTAGQERTKIEIKKDYEYLLKTWDEIRQKTLESVAPSLINEEADLVKKAIRDLYVNDMDAVYIEGEKAYKSAKQLMKMLASTHAKKIHQHSNVSQALFGFYGIEKNIQNIMSPKVNLPSGGYIIINHTEALISIDVNSGKATKERAIDETAFKTNIEAAIEIPRQLKIRDLSGLIVIDFIDMNEQHSINKVENTLKEALRSDRAKIQTSKISQFGLFEMSRQRLRSSIVENYSTSCAHCYGTGLIRSEESLSLQIIRALQEHIANAKDAFEFKDKHNIKLLAANNILLFIMNNQKRKFLELEEKYNVNIEFVNAIVDEYPFFKIDSNLNIAKKEKAKEQAIWQKNLQQPAIDDDVKNLNQENRKKRKKFKKKNKSIIDNPIAEDVVSSIDVVQNLASEDFSKGEIESHKNKAKTKNKNSNKKSFKQKETVEAADAVDTVNLQENLDQHKNNNTKNKKTFKPKHKEKDFKDSGAEIKNNSEDILDSKNSKHNDSDNLEEKIKPFNKNKKRRFFNKTKKIAE